MTRTIALTLLTLLCGACGTEQTENVLESLTSTPVPTTTPKPTSKLSLLCKPSPTAETWNPETQNALIESCVDAASERVDVAQASSYCLCMIGCIMNNYSEYTFGINAAYYIEIVKEANVNNCKKYADIY